MLERVAEIVTQVMDADGWVVDDFISIIFTATTDLVSEFPAYAARMLGFTDVPLIRTRELEIEIDPSGGPDDGARRARPPAADITHVYLHGAAALRRDLARVRAVPDAPADGWAPLPAPGALLIVGPGLLGTSLGLALRRGTSRCSSGSAAPSSQDRERSRRRHDTPVARRLVVVASHPTTWRGVDRAPPDRRLVTDVGSVKTAPLGALPRGPELERYFGSHPMAGSDDPVRLRRARPSSTAGPGPWSRTGSAPGGDRCGHHAGPLAGASVIRLSPEEHDLAVARTSPLPHLLAVLVAGRLADAPPSTSR